LSNIQPLIHIVDDDPAVVKALRRLLHSWGMQVRTHTSGEEFLSALRGSPKVDCSVIDLMMPGMTGLEVQEHMNHAGLDVPVIFITAHETEGAEEQALRGGAVGFLRKPFKEEALVELIRKAIHRRRKSVAADTGSGEQREDHDELI
jgi:FixJ family two-component response regulator